MESKGQGLSPQKGASHIYIHLDYAIVEFLFCIIIIIIKRILPCCYSKIPSKIQCTLQFPKQSNYEIVITFKILTDTKIIFFFTKLAENFQIQKRERETYISISCEEKDTKPAVTYRRPRESEKCLNALLR